MGVEVLDADSSGGVRRGLALLVAGALFMEILDATVIAPAAPHIAAPLVDLRILRIDTYRVTAGPGSVFRAVITAIPFLLPLFFQLGFGWTAAQAGLAVAPLFLGNALIKPATTPLMRRFGIRTVMLTWVLASAACLVGIAFLQPTTALPLLLGLLTLSGTFRSIGFTTYNSLAFAESNPRT